MITRNHAFGQHDSIFYHNVPQQSDHKILHVLIKIVILTWKPGRWFGTIIKDYFINLLWGVAILSGASVEGLKISCRRFMKFHRKYIEDIKIAHPITLL